MEKNKKKILIVLTRLPYPETDGTRKRIMEDLIKGVYEEFSLDLLVVGRDVLSVDSKKELEKYCDNIFIFRTSIFGLFSRMVKSVYSNRPLQVEMYYSKKVLDYIRNNKDKYNAFYFHTIRLGKYLEKLKTDIIDKTFFDFNDAISLNYQTAKKLASFPWSFIYWIEEKKVSLYELEIASIAKYVNFVSPFDIEYIKEKLKKDNVSLPCFYNISVGVEIKMIENVSKSNKILFFGNIKYPPNMDAVNFFVSSILPEVKKEIPDIKFVVAGNYSDKIKFKDSSSIEQLGFVDDINYLFSQVKMVVAPIRFGAGVPTKILEALSKGVPVISTEIGFRGIKKTEFKENGIICLKDVYDVKSWIENIKYLLLLKYNEKEMLSEKAVSFMEKEYSKEKIKFQYKNAFKKIIN